MVAQELYFRKHVKKESTCIVTQVPHNSFTITLLSNEKIGLIIFRFRLIKKRNPKSNIFSGEKNEK